MNRYLRDRLAQSLSKHRTSLRGCRSAEDGYLDKIARWCLDNSCHIILPGAGLEKLTSQADAPPVLFARGQIALLYRQSIALVGTRRASVGGLQNAVRLGRELADAGSVVVSGLAIGIDTAAMSGAFEAGGEVIAVLAHGLDTVYPRVNAAFAEALVDGGGLLISEYPPGTPPLKHHFPARNRIITALSSGVVVVEAPHKSGAMITARFAADYGRDVFAMPGPADDPGFAGNHSLIQDGAKLVCSANDILAEFQSSSNMWDTDSLERTESLSLFAETSRSSTRTGSRARVM